MIDPKYRALREADVAEFEIEQRTGEGWTLDQLAEHYEVCRCMDCFGNEPAHDSWCPYMLELTS